MVTDDSGNQSAPADFGFRVVVRPTAILRSSPPAAVVWPDGGLRRLGIFADPTLKVVRWAFDPGDGSGVVTTTVPTFNHAYAQLGRFDTSLVVTDDPATRAAGHGSRRWAFPTTPTAVAFSSAIANLGATVTFDGSGSSDPEQGCGSQLVAWAWSLDGGSDIVTDTPTIDSSPFGALTRAAPRSAWW